MENEEDPVSKQQISDAQAFGWRTSSGKQLIGGQEATAQEALELLIGLAGTELRFFRRQLVEVVGIEGTCTWDDDEEVATVLFVLAQRTEQSSVVTDGLIHSAGSPAANHQRFFATRIRVALTSGSTQEPEKSQHDPPTVVPQILNPVIRSGLVAPKINPSRLQKHKRKLLLPSTNPNHQIEWVKKQVPTWQEIEALAAVVSSVAIDVETSTVIDLGASQVLKKLKFLSLIQSNLTTFDFRITPNLETLSLIRFYNLKELFMPVCCQKLKHLVISGSKLITFDLGLTPNLETLSLLDCPNLKFLYLSKSRLRSLDLELIPNLEMLELYNCADFVELQVSAPYLNDCADFVELQVSAPCPNLKFLNLSKSRLRSLDLELIPNLEKLELYNCADFVELQVSAPLSAPCPNLKILNLSKSRLRSLDLELIPNLEKLYLNDCADFVELQVSAPCPNLKFLYFSESRLRSLDLELIPNLEKLELYNCADFVELQVSVACLNLKFLYLSKSRLRSLDLELIPNLEVLDLNDCADFVELQVSAPCPNLKFLNLSKSRLRSLDLELIPNLERLDLARCHELVDINAPVGCLKKVVDLNLCGCARLEKLPRDLGQCGCLEELDITHTRISHLPQGVFRLKGLLIHASLELLQLYDFPSEIRTTTESIW
ncbi:suppressor of npr1-1, constitutive 1-like protein isoform X1 [Tanacetum coccineum]|uniref:Suppressor of npr1-1, constitutive 1-like protein isoform X1 n=1 Tax=Tanacetum coccineum TaxID=301880 RepID=A0ABQ5HU56_9ASTR